MKILVTGGAGFIGSHLVDLFIETDHQVVVVDDLSTGSQKNLHPKAQFEKLDIRSQEFKDFLISQKPDIINHHAAHIHVGHSVEDPAHDAEVNIFGTLNLLDAAQKSGSVKKIIFASTGGAMYGHQPTPFNESMTPQPLSPYGISKRAAELYLYFYKEQFGINYICLRYANVYGPRQNPEGEAGVVAIFCQDLLSGKNPTINGDGTQTRDYVYVQDVAAANLLAIKKDVTGEFNIGTGVETDVNQIFNLVTAQIPGNWHPIHGPERPGEQETSSLSYQKAQDQLGWQPRINLDQGITLTVNFFKSQSKTG